MRKLILMLFVVCSAVVYGQQLGYVYSDSVLLSVPGYTRNVSKFDSLKQAYNKELEQGNAELQRQYDKLIKTYSPTEKETLSELKKRMNANDTISLRLLQDQAKMLQNKALGYDNMIKFVYARDIQPIVSKVNKAISEYAVVNKLTAVYIIEQLRQAVAYIDPKQDITKAIIRKLNK